MNRWLPIKPFSIVPNASAETRKTNAAQDINVKVQRMRHDQSSFYAVTATAFARVAPQAAWNVLTGYDRLHEFVPNLRSSRLLSRHADEVIIEQHVRAGFLFIKQSIYLKMKVVEQPISVIDISLLSGDMRQFESHWEITAARQRASRGTLITYSGTLEPKFLLPPLLGAPLIRSDVRNMVIAVIAEIERSV